MIARRKTKQTQAGHTRHVNFQCFAVDFQKDLIIHVNHEDT